MILGSLGLWELLALISRRPGATLSEHVWSVLAIHDARPTGWVWLLRVVAVIFTAWIVPHFALGWFTPTDPVPW